MAEGRANVSPLSNVMAIGCLEFPELFGPIRSASNGRGLTKSAKHFGPDRDRVD